MVVIPSGRMCHYTASVIRSWHYAQLMEPKEGISTKLWHLGAHFNECIWECLYFRQITAAETLLSSLRCQQAGRAFRSQRYLKSSCQTAKLHPDPSVVLTAPLLRAAGGCTWPLDRHVWRSAWKRIRPPPPFVAPSAPELCPAENKTMCF